MSNRIPVLEAPTVVEEYVVIDVNNFHERHEAMRALLAAIVS